MRWHEVAIPQTMDAIQTQLPGLNTRQERLSGRTMGTTWSVSAYCPPEVSRAELLQQVESALGEVIAQMSNWEPSSNLNAFHRAAAGTWVTVPFGLYAVVECALQVARLSGGAFDPTLGEAVNRWGFGPSGPIAELPKPAVATGPPAWQRLRLRERPLSIWQPGGVALDLCGIAKGFAVDLVAEALQLLGLASFLVEIGGEIRGRGIKADGQPWWCGIEAPEAAMLPAVAPQQEGRILAKVAMAGCAIATSGHHRRQFTLGGRRYSHTIDPLTGVPLTASPRLNANDLPDSVSVVSPRCMEADAWATALLVLGARQGLALANQLGLAAFFVLPDGCCRSEVWQQMLD